MSLKNKLTEIIIKAVGEDKEWGSYEDDEGIVNNSVIVGYNQALADIRAKAPVIVEQVLGEITKAVEGIELSPGPEDLDKLAELTNKTGAYGGFGYGQVWSIKKIINSLK